MVNTWESKVLSSQNEATLLQVLHKAIECVYRQCEAGVKLNKASKAPIAIQLIVYAISCIAMDALEALLTL